MSRPRKLSLKLQQQQIKNVFNKIFGGKLNRIKANKTMKSISLNADITNLMLDIDFVKCEIASNHSQEENIDTYVRNKKLIDSNPSQDYPIFAVSSR